MSNCISLNAPPVRLTAMQIDVVALKTLVQRVKDLREPPSCDTDGDGYIAWWFLSHAQFDGDKMVFIEFGDGRSTHTWRDFGATMLLIGRLARMTFDLRFEVQDTDAPSKWGKATWRVIPNGGDWTFNLAKS
jgi:hypothetical protein